MFLLRHHHIVPQIEWEQGITFWCSHDIASTLLLLHQQKRHDALLPVKHRLFHCTLLLSPHFLFALYAASWLSSFFHAFLREQLLHFAKGKKKNCKFRRAKVLLLSAFLPWFLFAVPRTSKPSRFWFISFRECSRNREKKPRSEEMMKHDVGCSWFL